MAALNVPTSMVINRELFDYTKKILEVVFELLAAKEQNEMDKKALESLSLLKVELDKSAQTISGHSYLTWLSVQEFSVLRNELKPTKHLHEYADKFQIATYDQDIKQNAVIFQGVVDSPETMFRIGHWVGVIHQMNINNFGSDYKIDPDWDIRPNN